MKTTASPLLKTALIIGFFFLSSVGSNLLTTKPAQAVTWPEIGKIFGVWSRYIDDIQKPCTTNNSLIPNPQNRSTPKTRLHHPVMI